MKFNTSADMLILAASEWKTAQSLLNKGEDKKAQILADSATARFVRAISHPSFKPLAIALNEYNEKAFSYETGSDMDIPDPDKEEMDIDSPDSHKVVSLKALPKLQDEGLDPNIGIQSPQFSERQGDSPPETNVPNIELVDPEEELTEEEMLHIQNLPSIDNQTQMIDEPNKLGGGQIFASDDIKERIKSRDSLLSKTGELLAACSTKDEEQDTEEETASSPTREDLLRRALQARSK